MANRRIVLVVIVAFIVAFFLSAPVIYYDNTSQHAGHVAGYESLSCALFNVGVSYGYPSFLANEMVLMPSCGPT